MGSKTVDDPNPATVPIMTEPKDAMRKIMSCSIPAGINIITKYVLYFVPKLRALN